MMYTPHANSLTPSGTISADSLFFPSTKLANNYRYEIVVILNYLHSSRHPKLEAKHKLYNEGLGVNHKTLNCKHTKLITQLFWYIAKLIRKISQYKHATVQ